MRKILLYIIPLAVAIVATGCLEDMRKDETGDVYSEIEVRLVLPEGVDISLAGAEIVVSNASKTRSIVYTARTNAQGVAQLVVEKGIYDVRTQIEAVIDGDETLIMGSSNKLDATKPVETVIDLIRAYHVGKLIIKEAYFCGCKDNNNSNYTMKDTYVIIYNNSDEVQYLDEMGFATAADTNTQTSSSGWTPVFNEGKVALYQYAFSFPTNETGDRFPLQPGEEAVVCLYAINHRTVASTSIDLGKEGYFAMYYPGFGTQTPPDSERGVITMDLINASGSLPMYSISTMTPAFILYKIDGMSPLEYKEQPGALMKKPGTSASTEYLVIDKRWILDGVEFGNANSSNLNPRIPVEVNTDIPKNNVTNGSGISWHRKVKDVIDGRIIYQDTNNTTEDFEQRDRASLRED